MKKIIAAILGFLFAVIQVPLWNDTGLWWPVLVLGNAGIAWLIGWIFSN